MKNRLASHRGWFIWVVAVVFAASLQAQVYEYPYISAPARELSVRRMLDAGMARRAVADINELLRTRTHSAVFDVVAFDQADLFRASDNRAGADRAMLGFTRERPTSPFTPIAWLERARAATEDGAIDDAVELYARCAALSREAAVARQDTFYVRMAHTSSFWEGACRAGIGQFKEAIDAFGRCVQDDPSGTYAAWSWYASGQLYERNADLPAAIACFDTVRRMYPRSSVAIASRIRQAVAFIALRQPERALDVLSGVDQQIAEARQQQMGGAVDAERAEEEVALIRAQALTLRQRYAESFDSTSAFLRTYPNSSYRWIVRLHGALAALQDARPESALPLLDQILDSVTSDADPVRQQAMLYHAVAVKKLGRTAEAEKEFAALAALTGYPFQAAALIETALVAYEAGEMDKARKYLERAEKLSPDARTTVRAMVFLGAVFVEQQQWEKAANVYDRAQKLVEDAEVSVLPGRNEYLAEIQLFRGVALQQSGQSQKAIVALTEFLGDHPTDPRKDEATFWLAEAMYRIDLLKNAQELYEEIVRRYTASRRREEAMYGLAWTYFRRRDFDKSTAMFGELLKTFPKSAYASEAMARRGDGLYIMRQFHAAADQYDAAAGASPNSEEGLYSAYQAGQASYRAGDLSGAVQRMKRFVNTYPNSRLADDAMFLIGWIAFQRRDEEQAITDFRKLLDAYPDGDQAVRALYTIADAEYNLGRVDAALGTYQSVIARYPRHPLAAEAARSMQIALVGMGRTEDAIRIADTLIALNPTSDVAADFSWRKAEIFYSGKNYTSAASELLAYMQRHPSSERKDEALYQLGRTYLGMSDLVQARQAFNTLEKDFPKSTFVPLALIDLGEYYVAKANSTSADSVYRIVWTRFRSDTDAASRAGYERGLIARAKADTLAAIERFRETADLFGDAEYADQSRYQTAALYKRLGRLDSAEYHLRLLSVRSDKPAFAATALYEIGTMYLRQKRYSEAIVQYEKVRTDYAGIEDWYTLSLLALGECYEALKQWSDAQVVYDTIQRLRPEDDYGKTAVARTKRLKKVQR